MATGGLYGNSGTGALVATPGAESSGLYGNSTNFGGTYFEWFIFQVSETQPATPTGGSWSFSTNTGTAPSGWTSTPPTNPTNTVWVSISIVTSRNTTSLTSSVPGKFSYSSGLPILSGSGAPLSGDGQSDQLYIQLDTTPQTIWFKETGTWTRLTGSSLYADLTSNQTIAGTKTFSSQIQGSISGNAANVTGTVAIANGGTGSTTAGTARAALGAAASGANSDITSLTGLTTALSLAQGGTGATTAADARTNLGLGSAAVLTAGAANGVATLDAGGTVPLSQIPASIQGGVNYQGTWNATTNTPTLTSSVGTKGYYYVVSVAGSTNLNGITNWDIGDWAIFNGTAWEKIDNTDAVTSVNGYTGTVVLTQPDIAGTASLTTVQTLTNKTLTSPKINEILDTNGNEILGLSPTASATDFLTVKNGIGVGAPLHIYADGSSTNVGLHIQPKGSGLVTISDGTDFNKGIRFRSSGSAASAVTLLDAVATAGRVVTLPDATTTLVGRDTTDTLTNKTFGDNPTFSAGTANGVTYLNGSKVLTSGSALTFDGTNLGVATTSPVAKLDIGGIGSTQNGLRLTNFSGSPELASFTTDTSTGQIRIGGTNGSAGNYFPVFYANGSEQMRLTSTGLGIGTTSPTFKLVVAGDTTDGAWLTTSGTASSLGLGGYSAAGSGAGRISFDRSNGVMTFSGGTRDTPSTRMTLDNSGNLGIGTSSPGAKLEVSGSFTTTADASGTTTFGRYSSGYAWSLIRPSSTATGIEFRDFVGNALYQLDQSSGANKHLWYTGANERMRLDSSGNLGLGVTPTSTWNAAFKVLEMSGGSLSVSGNGPYINQNATFDSTWRYKTTAAAAQYAQVLGQHQWYTAASGTAGNAISFTQAMTLDANGSLGVGTTSPSARLDVSGGSGGIMYVRGTGDAYQEIVSGGRTPGTDSLLVGQGNSGEAYLFNRFNSYLVLGTNGAERARIDSSGYFLVNTTATVGGASRIGVLFAGNATNGINIQDSTTTSGAVFQQFSNSSGTQIGYIGRVTTTNAVVYSTTSDYRLKTVIGPVSGAGARIDALKPVDYQWKEGNQHARGFLAHEFQEVYANSVSGTKDAVNADGKPVYQGMQASTSEVIADLVAEIQSLRQRLAAAGIA